MGCHFLLQGTFLIQDSTPHLLHWQADSLPLNHQASPWDYPLSWCHCKSPEKKRKEVEEGRVRDIWWCYPASLKMEEGAWSQGMQVASRSHKRKTNKCFSRFSRRNTDLSTLWLQSQKTHFNLLTFITVVYVCVLLSHYICENLLASNGKITHVFTYVPISNFQLLNSHLHWQFAQILYPHHWLAP